MPPNGCAQLDALNKAREGDSDDMDDAQQDIDQSALDVQVRDGWKSPGAESDGPEEFEILISTGGPASRIVGDLDEHGQVVNARLRSGSGRRSTADGSSCVGA